MKLILLQVLLLVVQHPPLRPRLVVLVLVLHHQALALPQIMLKLNLQQQQLQKLQKQEVRLMWL
jgi:hypothetical protein